MSNSTLQQGVIRVMQIQYIFRKDCPLKVEVKVNKIIFKKIIQRKKIMIMMCYRRILLPFAKCK